MFLNRTLLICAISTLIPYSASAVPVVPNFSQGQMTSTTDTTSTVSEVINSMDYNTGWQYTVTGTGIQMDSGSSLSPSDTTSTSITIEGVTSTWTGLDLNNKPNFTLTTPGVPFQFTEAYVGPGLSNHTVIIRDSTIESVTTTTSIFSQ